MSDPRIARNNVGCEWVPTGESQHDYLARIEEERTLYLGATPRTRIVSEFRNTRDVHDKRGLGCRDKAPRAYNRWAKKDYKHTFQMPNVSILFNAVATRAVALCILHENCRLS